MKEELLQYIEFMTNWIDADPMLKQEFIDGYKRALADVKQVIEADFDARKIK